MYWMFSVTETNWALGHGQGQGQTHIHSSQSSTTHNKDAPPSNAIDGNADGNFAHHSCSKTTADSSGHVWWSATFKELIEVEGIIITNRADCCGELQDNKINI